MMAYHQRVSQFRSRIDFDDPSTTKPSSLAKSAVLQALEDEERQQSRAGKGWQRPSRSRQRDVPAVPRLSRTPCINRDTVMRINRRPVRHRSCDNFWPPARTPSPLDRAGGPSVGETEGGSFAYDGVRRYGSNESVYFDVENVCKQHKIDPLRTKFDKANVVLVDWGRKSAVINDIEGYDKRCREKSDDTANNSIKRGENIESEKFPSQLRKVAVDVKPKSSDENVVSVSKSDEKMVPPAPPPRRYFIPMEQMQPGLGVNILLQCYKVSSEPDEQLNNPISTTIDNYFNIIQQSSSLPAAVPVPDSDGILQQDGIQSKPPLKARSTSTKRTNLGSKPPTPVHFYVSHNDTHNSNSPVPGKRDGFNINSDTILNLNIDTAGSSLTVVAKAPQITVTGCPDQTTDATTNHFDKRRPMGYQQQQQLQQLQTMPPKTNDQLLNEIIDENHNYNEKLITNSGGSNTESYPTASSTFIEIDSQCLSEELPNEQHSKLNVSNQPNRNWINLNSNEIHPNSGSGSTAAVVPPPGSQWGEDAATAGARMAQTRVRCNSIDAATASSAASVSRPPKETNDGRPTDRNRPTATDVDKDDDSDVRNNYDNKSVKSNYWDTGRVAYDALSLAVKDERQEQQQQLWQLERSDSRDSSRSWRVDEVLEFPPPPPYLCLCDDGSVPSGRCSEARSAFDSPDSGAQICDNRSPTPTRSPGQPSHGHATWTSRADNPTISQSCRQDSTSSTIPSPVAVRASDVCPWSERRWDDNHAAAVTGAVHQHRQPPHRTDDYFRTNLTDDKFLNENVNIASNLSGDRRGQQQLRTSTTDDPRVSNVDGVSDGDRMVNRFYQVPPFTGARNFNPLHKSIDAFLDAERQTFAENESVTANVPMSDSTPPPIPPPPEESENSSRFVSFTDGEYIFGPYDARSEEFQRFDLWDGDFHKRQHCHRCRPCKKRSPSGTPDGSAGSVCSSSSTLCPECHCRRSSATSIETLREVEEPPENDAPKSPQQQQQQRKANQVENYDDTPRNVPAGNEPPQESSYRRWVRFENGNIGPPRTTVDQHRSPTPARIPTPYPSPPRTMDAEADDHTPEQRHQDVFDQFTAALEHQPQPGPPPVDLVENIPLIDAVLDDLLTFSKTLVLRQNPASCAGDLPLALEREEAKIVEINDDNLINLLADDDDNSSATKVVGETNHGLVVESGTGSKTLPSKPDLRKDDAGSSGWHQENSDDESFRVEKCDLNSNEQKRPQLESGQHHRSDDDSKDMIDNYLSKRRNQEDIFTNVAIFNWNPLDVYHQHGLFMIDPRFALADLHATSPDTVRDGSTFGQDDSTNKHPSAAPSVDDHTRNDAYLNSEKPTQPVAMQDADATAAIGKAVRITDGADPSPVDVNSFATQLETPALTDEGCCRLLESHEIPNDSAGASRGSPAAVGHFYDSAHVEYPVRADLGGTIQQCHQSPKESDYDNDPAKTTATSNRRGSRDGGGSCSGRASPQRPDLANLSSDGTEGLKRVAWPPPAEFDGEYQQPQPVQQQQQPYHYPPQQQPAHQQPLQQNYPQQQQQQHYQQPHTQPQQHQPRERIIPIQRATSHTSPLNTPKSPVNQLKYPSYPPSLPHQTPQYPIHQQPSPVGSSTVAFSGGRAVLPQKQQHQQQKHQQPARPVSAPYHQQQPQQQSRYSSPSTASLASPRSPQIVGGGHSPRGWAHVQSPVPVYRPTPQQHQHQQQYVPPPFQTEPAPYQQQQRPTSAGAGYGHGYGPRKLEPSNQQPQYQPQPTQAFQPPVSTQNQQQLYQHPEAVVPQQQQQHQQFYHTTAADSQIPFVTTLRKEAPMSQEPTPVYHTEPVAAIYQGGTNMRGDQKWPPADVKKQSELENEERRKLAQQPAFRPRKVQKDYSDFFAKNALNATYPGYRAPPGTQHHS
ncbi:uncharacterized protein LOC134217767 isoform X2 [Armigeres subalbatus]|uniref:uncharacterized protein LOC134217767 isoform X2 n=1 Tax=Armigeres subalbatus TaxID=124917 RepID=UPI002ED5A99C